MTNDYPFRVVRARPAGPAAAAMDALVSRRANHPSGDSQGAPMSSISSTWIILGVLVVLVVWIIMIYNGLVAMRQRVNQSFADIDVQLKQRSDLIPNLVETVKGYAGHERGTLEAVVKARNSAMQAQGP